MVCEICGKIFDIDWRKNSHSKKHLPPKFCSRSCSNKRVHTEKTKRKIGLSKKRIPDKFCKICNKKMGRRSFSSLCSNCRVKYKKYDNEYFYVRDYRKKIKEKAVLYKGGKCVICGYNKCFRALDFHHKNPKEKDFNISFGIKKWENTKKELDKCILVCANCHREIEEELINIGD